MRGINNPETRLVYADWLDECGDDIGANGQRWQVERGLAPSGFGEQTRFWSVLNDGFSDGLPINVFLELTGFSVSGSAFKSYLGRQAAERALAEALDRLGIVAESKSPK